jgi:hypothetical protein
MLGEKADCGKFSCLPQLFVDLIHKVSSESKRFKPTKTSSIKCLANPSGSTQYFQQLKGV